MASRKTEPRNWPNIQSWGSLWHGCQSQPTFCWQSVMELVNCQAPLSCAKTLWGGLLQSKLHLREVSCPGLREIFASSLITYLNVNEAGLVIQLSGRCTHLSHCRALGPHGEPPLVFRDSPLFKLHSNIATTPFSQDLLARSSSRGCLCHFLCRPRPIASEVGITNQSKTGNSLTAWLEFRTISLISPPLLEGYHSEAATTA